MSHIDVKKGHIYKFMAVFAAADAQMAKTVGHMSEVSEDFKMDDNSDETPKEAFKLKKELEIRFDMVNKAIWNLLRWVHQHPEAKPMLNIMDWSKDIRLENGVFSNSIEAVEIVFSGGKKKKIHINENEGKDFSDQLTDAFNL